MASAHRLMVFAALLGTGACTEDPVYLAPADQLEVVDPAVAASATGTITLPVSAAELALDEPDRAMLEAELGVMVPQVRLGDLSVSVEWSVKNLSDTDGIARVQVNGGNEWFYFDPLLFVVDPDEDEQPPPLMGDIPLSVPAGGLITGVFREDQFVEAAVDLELMSRGGLNPIAATLEIHEDTQEIVSPTGGTPVPRQAFAGMVRFDFVFVASAHMVMEYAVRVRDHRGILHDMLLSAPPGELTAFAPAAIQPPAPTN